MPDAPLRLSLECPFVATHAPGGVDLTLFPTDAPPVCVRLHGPLVQLLVASLRTAHAPAPAEAVLPPELAALSPRERLAAAFAAVLSGAPHSAARGCAAPAPSSAPAALAGVSTTAR